MTLDELTADCTRLGRFLAAAYLRSPTEDTRRTDWPSGVLASNDMM